MDVIKLINKALSDEDIGTVLGADTKIIRYSELRHIDDLDELLTKEIDYCIILYEDRPDRGHWTALSRYNSIYEHFDSYGNRPDKSLDPIYTRLYTWSIACCLIAKIEVHLDLYFEFYTRTPHSDVFEKSAFDKIYSKV